LLANRFRAINNAGAADGVTQLAVDQTGHQVGQRLSLYRGNQPSTAMP